MNVTTQAFNAAFAEFGLAFGRSFPSEAEVAGHRMQWRGMLDRNDWIDDAVFGAAVAWTIDTVKDYLPSPATFLERCRELRREREEDERWRTLLLPKPREKRIDELGQEERDALRAVMHRARADAEAKRAQEAGR